MSEGKGGRELRVKKEIKSEHKHWRKGWRGREGGREAGSDWKKWQKCGRVRGRRTDGWMDRGGLKGDSEAAKPQQADVM